MADSGDEGTNGFAHNDAFQVFALSNVKNNDGQVILLAKGEGRFIHDIESFTDGFAKGNFIELDSGGVFFGVGGVDTIDACSLEDYIGVDFVGPQGSGRIGGEVGATGTSGEDDHASFFQMADGPAADVRLGHLLYADGRNQASKDAQSFQGALQCHAVDNGGEHPHIVALHAFDSGGFGLEAPEDITTADDDGYFHALFDEFLDFFGIMLEHCGGDSVALLPHQGFTA